MRRIELAPLMTLRVDVGEALSLGEIRLVPLVGGEFSGEGLAGRVLPGGGDWQEVRGRGLRHAAAEMAERLVLSHGRRLARCVELSVHSVR